MSLGKTPRRCPCCGQGVTREIAHEAAAVRLSPMEQRMFDIIRDSRSGIETDRLTDRLYENDRDGGPSSTNIIAVMKININRKIAKVGLQIERLPRGSRDKHRIVEIARADS